MKYLRTGLQIYIYIYIYTKLQNWVNYAKEKICQHIVVVGLATVIRVFLML